MFVFLYSGHLHENDKLVMVLCLLIVLVQYETPILYSSQWYRWRAVFSNKMCW